MKENEKHKFILIVTLMLAPIAALHADDVTTAASDDWEQEISTRRTEYLNWIVENFGMLEPAMDVRDGRRWALNHAQLVLGRNVDKANGYFEALTTGNSGRMVGVLSHLQVDHGFHPATVAAVRRDPCGLDESPAAGSHRVLAD